MTLYVVAIQTDIGPIYHRDQESWDTRREQGTGFSFGVAQELATRHHGEIERQDGRPLRLVIERGAQWLSDLIPGETRPVWARSVMAAKVYDRWREAAADAARVDGRVMEATANAGVLGHGDPRVRRVVS